LLYLGHPFLEHRRILVIRFLSTAASSPARIKARGLPDDVPQVRGRAEMRSVGDAPHRRRVAPDHRRL